MNEVSPWIHLSLQYNSPHVVVAVPIRVIALAIDLNIIDYIMNYFRKFNLIIPLTCLFSSSLIAGECSRWADEKVSRLSIVKTICKSTEVYQYFLII